MLVFDDTVEKDKLKFYRKGFQKTPNGVEKFDGAYEVLPLSECQPLAEEHKHFYNAIINDTQPLTDGLHALEVLEILELATKRMNNVNVSST